MTVNLHQQLMREHAVFPLNGLLERFDRPIVDPLVDENLEMEEKWSGGFQPIAVLLQIVDDAFGFAKGIAAAGEEQVEHVVLSDECVKAVIHRSLREKRRLKCVRFAKASTIATNTFVRCYFFVYT